MSLKSSFTIFNDFENNKENIDPLTGKCSKIFSLQSQSQSSLNIKKRAPLRDITPTIKKVPTSPKKIRPSNCNSFSSHSLPVFNLNILEVSTTTSISTNTNIITSTTTTTNSNTIHPTLKTNSKSTISSIQKFR